MRAVEPNRGRSPRLYQNGHMRQEATPLTFRREAVHPYLHQARLPPRPTRLARLPVCSPLAVTAILTTKRTVIVNLN